MNLDSIFHNSNWNEILLNRFDDLYMEENGEIRKTVSPFKSESEYRRFVAEILESKELSLSPRTPTQEFLFQQRFRVTLVHEDLCLGNIPMSIRKLTPAEIPEIWIKSMVGEFKNALAFGISERKNILIVGGTGSGKSTLALHLINSCATQDRIITIEDTPELNSNHPGQLKLLTRQANSEGIGAVNMDQLLKVSLRLRPDRLIIGEIRGAEVVPFFQALNTGHHGSFCTLHANNARSALERLSTLFLMYQPNATLEVALRLIRQTIDWIVVVSRNQAERKIISINSITGLEGNNLLLEPVQL